MRSISVALCPARGAEKKEQPEQTSKTVSFNENKQPIIVNTPVPQANKTDRVKRFPVRERKTFDSGSYGTPSTETKVTSQADTSDKKQNF